MNLDLGSPRYDISYFLSDTAIKKNIGLYKGISIKNALIGSIAVLI